MEDSSSYLEPFPSPALVVIIWVDKGRVEFFTRGKTGSSTIVCTVGKVLTGLSLLAPRIGMDIIL